MPEPTQLCSILSIERIAAYLGVVPGKVRTTLRNLADGGYAVEVDPGQWVRVISVPVERKAGFAWTPRIQQEGE
jgi:hypothetical protein